MGSCAGQMLLRAIAAAAVLDLVSSSALPRRVQVRGTEFVLAETGEPIVLRGPNVVVKGPPYLPAVSGSSVCKDVVNKDCMWKGTCVSCQTFNEADVKHIKSMGWNSIRLSVVWAGAQPRDEDALDADFLQRLHAILNLTDRTGIHVVLDNHGDMVGSAGCGNGVPMWFQRKAAPGLIGKPLTTALPYSLVPHLRVWSLPGYSHCSSNATKWAQFAGDPNYNLLNECCQHLNMHGNPPALGYTTLSQTTMDYLFGDGRADFVRFWVLLMEAVRNHPSAFAAELMNEPISIRRTPMFDTWRVTAEAVNARVPDMAVALADLGEVAVVPAWVSKIGGEDIALSSKTIQWIKDSKTAFYAWHYYGEPATPGEAVRNVLALSRAWDVPTFLTEFMDCDAWTAAAGANISHSYWHYSDYCTTGPAFGNRTVPRDTFGACILGWGGGTPSAVCGRKELHVTEVII